jgi:uncharacterized membrane protein
MLKRRFPDNFRTLRFSWFHAEAFRSRLLPIGMTRITLLFLALTACTTAQSTGISAVSCAPDNTLTYASYGQAFIQDNCLSCHKSKERPYLNTQAQVQANASKILQQAVYTTAMPEDADMAIADRETLDQWLACGAP